MLHVYGIVKQKAEGEHYDGGLLCRHVMANVLHICWFILLGDAVDCFALQSRRLNLSE